MKILFILDPDPKLTPRIDTSLALATVLQARGHHIYFTQSSQVYSTNEGPYAITRQIVMKPDNYFDVLARPAMPLKAFGVISLRKEPPFDTEYLYLTHMLSQASKHAFVSNDPVGMRELNEKICILNFKKWIPETLVTCQTNVILDFQKKLKSNVVLKRLDYKWGLDVVLLPYKATEPEKLKIITTLSQRGKRTLMAQEFVQATPQTPEKRITLLNGEVLTAYEKKNAKNEFRANIHLGGTYHATKITAKDQRMIDEVGSFLKKKGIHSAGLDVVDGKLFEINITSPGALLEATSLYDKHKPLIRWAKFLEKNGK